jgi:hypothetical protein
VVGIGIINWRELLRRFENTNVHRYRAEISVAETCLTLNLASGMGIFRDALKKVLTNDLLKTPGRCANSIPTTLIAPGLLRQSQGCCSG